jgi:hypothetical protein
MATTRRDELLKLQHKAQAKWEVRATSQRTRARKR